MSASDVSTVLQEHAREFAAREGRIDHHGAESFFDGFPPWSGEKPDLNLKELGDYIMDTALTALIPTIAGFLVLVVCTVLVIIRHSCLSNRFDKKLVDRRRKEGKEKLAHLAFSTILIQGIAVFLGLGGIGTIVVCESADSLSNIVNGLLQEIRLAGLAFMDFILWIERRIEVFDPSRMNDGSDSGQFLELAFSTVVDYVPERFPKVSDFRKELADFLTSLVHLVDRISDAVQWIFVGSVGFGHFALLALCIAFCTEMFTKQRTCCRVVAHMLFISVPLLVSWILFAVFTGAGVGLADGCQLISGYRTYITDGTLQNTTANLLVDQGGLVCPNKTEAAKLEAEMVAASDVVVNNPLASDTLVKMLEVKGGDLNETTEWAVEEIRDYINCKILNEFAGKIENQLCGDRSTSLIAGVHYLWISNMMVSILLSILLVGSIFGSPVLWAATVWPMPTIDQTMEDFSSKYDVEDGEGGKNDNSLGRDEVCAGENDESRD